MKKNICNNIYEAYEFFGTSVSVMVGAGLSVPMPTGIPPLPQIVKSLMNLDWFDGDEKFPINSEDLFNRVASKIRLEHIFSIFYEWGKHDPGELITQFRDAEPNFYHYQIAELVKKNIINRIFTTNFDLCIEKALDAYDIPYKQIVDETDFSKATNNDLWVIKLHGTVCPYGNTQSTKGLIATLESMSKGIEHWKAQCLHESIDQNGLVCLGYSGRDSFDINPILRQKPNQKILWVVHNTTNIEINHTLQFSQFKNPVNIDITTFLGETKKLAIPKDFHFQRVYSLSELWHPSVFLGRVLESAQEYEAAKGYYENVLINSTGSNYWMVEIINIHRSLGVCNYELANYKEALYYLILARALLNGYYESVKKDGRTPHEIAKKIFLDHGLLISEEFWLVHHKLNDICNLKEEEKMLFDFFEQYEQSFGPQPAIRSRLLLNRASIRLDWLIKKEPYCQYDYKDINRDLEEVCDIKDKIGDIVGRVMALALLSRTKLMLGKSDYAIDLLLKSFTSIRKLSSSIPTTVIELVVISICVTHFYKLTLGYSPVNRVPDYDRMNESFRNKFESRVKELLYESLIEVLDRDGFFTILEEDPSLQELLRALRQPVTKEGDPYLKEMSEVAREFGVSIVTPDDKIEEYRKGLGSLKYIKGPSAYAITKAAQWHAIGDQYKKAGDRLQAVASYQIALNSLKPAPTSSQFTDEQKRLWIKELEKALAVVSDV